MAFLRLAIELNGAHPFSLGEKVARVARRMRALPRSMGRGSRAHPHPYPSPVGEGRRTLTTQSHVARVSRGRLLLVLLALLASLAGPALAVQPDEVMNDPALETRARALSEELRCLVCQNQSIDDSDAPLARDIRILIRQRIASGESNDTVRAYLVSRYGDFILLKPPFKPETTLLWLSPALVLAAGLAATLYARRRAPRSTPPLSAEEEARLSSLTGGDAGRG
jgi:cytochrome c-type biogenesis protein CcmH